MKKDVKRTCWESQDRFRYINGKDDRQNVRR